MLAHVSAYWIRQPKIALLVQSNSLESKLPFHLSSYFSSLFLWFEHLLQLYMWEINPRNEELLNITPYSHVVHFTCCCCGPDFDSVCFFCVCACVCVLACASIALHPCLQFDMQQLSLDELKQVLFHAFRDHLTMKDIENIIITEEESLNETSGNCPEYEGGEYSARRWGKKRMRPLNVKFSIVWHVVWMSEASAYSVCFNGQVWRRISGYLSSSHNYGSFLCKWCCKLGYSHLQMTKCIWL